MKIRVRGRKGAITDTNRFLTLKAHILANSYEKKELESIITVDKNIDFSIKGRFCVNEQNKRD